MVIVVKLEVVVIELVVEEYNSGSFSSRLRGVGMLRCQAISAPLSQGRPGLRATD